MNERPIVLGLFILTFRCLFLGLGTKALMTCESRDEYGNKLEEGVAAFQGIAFVVFREMAILLGLYKIIAG